MIVNHEKRLGIDTTCSNLAIKYDMLYISAYQLIKNHITSGTEWGVKLQQCQNNKDIQLTTQVRDEFNEHEYSPVHFDKTVVMDLIKYTINKEQYTQKLVLLEGMCNSTKLGNEDDQLEMRYMDELQDIEDNIGDIAGILGLQFAYVPEVVPED